jgi:hypothetical protein
MFRHWTSFRQRALSKTQAKDLPDMVNITQTGRKISAIEAYKARGPLLRRFCLYDYLACVEIRQKGGTQTSSNWIPFDDSSEICDSMIQHICCQSNIATVVLDGVITDDFDEAPHEIYYQRCVVENIH